MQFIPVERNFNIANNEAHHLARIEAGIFLYRDSELPSVHIYHYISILLLGGNFL
jgi:hypothetical protein